MSARLSADTGGPGRTAAVPYLRRRTVGRAAESYRRWIGRAVGWWTILYLIFWLVVFVIAGVETIEPLPTFLPSPAAVLAAAGAGSRQRSSGAERRRSPSTNVTFTGSPSARSSLGGAALAIPRQAGGRRGGRLIMGPSGRC